MNHDHSYIRGQDYFHLTVNINKVHFVSTVLSISGRLFKVYIYIDYIEYEIIRMLMMLQLEHISNEIFLCIWDYLSSADVIYSFSNLNNRFNSLLSEFYGLYKQLDLRDCSLAACRFLSSVVPTMAEWHLNLTVLKMGSRGRCSEVNLFIDGLVKSCGYISKDTSRSLMAYKHIKPIFPQLVALHIYLPRLFDAYVIDTLLFVIAGGTKMRTFICDTCPTQVQHSKTFFHWLFQCSINLIRYTLQSSQTEDGFELSYEHTIVNNYIQHYSLVHLKIDILNLNTLYILMHYLPQLLHLDVNISSVIGRTNDINQNLITKLDYPKKLRVLILRHFQVAGPNCIYLEQLVDKYKNTLEEFSLFFVHFCDGEFDICFDGHRLATLCARLIHLQVLHFSIQLQFLVPPSRQILDGFIKAFRTSFWLDGPLGQMRVCVNYHRVVDYVQIFSLPYTFFDNPLSRATDLIDTLFNTDEKMQGMTNDLSVVFKSLWRGMKRIYMCFLEKEKIPISIFHALQCPSSQGKTLGIPVMKGILPNDIPSRIQLTHFTSLQLLWASDTTIDYDIQHIIGWIRLLPNIKILFVSTRELSYWITNGYDNQYLQAFLEHINRLYIDCSFIVNEHLNEELMNPLLSFIINKQRFPRLEYLRFVECKHTSSAWCDINKWIDYILTHMDKHQLKHLWFSFIDKGQQLTDMKTGDEIITNNNPPCIIDIHRFVSEDHISFWMERKFK
ncbi:unnamed protein product [Adineta ricciae]|uniref:F-box domain-containing protein n=1 Tax=Adineta ricciae TaxID=249248 RepID=A0A814Q3Z0_ADIRI|nr:unnamed protein product [Adineta ricciae]